jgi:hypothetical protein
LRMPRNMLPEEFVLFQRTKVTLFDPSECSWAAAEPAANSYARTRSAAATRLSDRTFRVKRITGSSLVFTVSVFFRRLRNWKLDLQGQVKFLLGRL